jgi:hypothetical protein
MKHDIEVGTFVYNICTKYSNSKCKLIIEISLCTNPPTMHIHLKECMIGVSPFPFCVHGYYSPLFENSDLLKFSSQESHSSESPFDH